MALYRNKRKHRRVVEAIPFKQRPDAEPDAAGFYPVGIGQFAKPGDYIVQRAGAAMRVMTADEFLAKFEPVNTPKGDPDEAVVDAVEDAPEPAVDDIPVEPPKPKKKRTKKATKKAPKNKARRRAPKDK